MTELELQNFNSVFSLYEGKEVRGYRVESLIHQVISNNNRSSLKISVYGAVTLNSEDNNPQYSDSFSTSNLYDVKMNYNEYGVICSISIVALDEEK